MILINLRKNLTLTLYFPCLPSTRAYTKSQSKGVASSFKGKTKQLSRNRQVFTQLWELKFIEEVGSTPCGKSNKHHFPQHYFQKDSILSKKEIAVSMFGIRTQQSCCNNCPLYGLNPAWKLMKVFIIFYRVKRLAARL